MVILHKLRGISAKTIEPKARICFIHIAKCGGVSINQAIRRKYLVSYSRLNARASLEAARAVYGFEDPFDDGYASVFRFRENILLYELEKGSGFISGHYAFSERAYQMHSDRYRFITVLRDPVAMFLSNYFFNSSKENDSPWKIRLPLDEYVETQKAKDLGHGYVTILGGVREDGRYDSDEALERARENLRKFAVCGVIEDTPGFERQLEDKCGIRIKIGMKNKSPVRKSERDKIVTEEIREKVRKAVARDLVLYEDARKISEAYSAGVLAGPSVLGGEAVAAK